MPVKATLQGSRRQLGAHSRSLQIVLRALAARKSPQRLGLGRRANAEIAAIRSLCSEIFDGNSRVAVDTAVPHWKSDD